jgi:hypothetical protein
MVNVQALIRLAEHCFSNVRRNFAAREAEWAKYDEVAFLHVLESQRRHNMYETQFDGASGQWEEDSERDNVSWNSGSTSAYSWDSLSDDRYFAQGRDENQSSESYEWKGSLADEIDRHYAEGRHRREYQSSSGDY